MLELIAAIPQYLTISLNTIVLFFARSALSLLITYPINVAVFCLILLIVGYKVLRNSFKRHQEMQEPIQFGAAVNKERTVGEIREIQKEIEEVQK